AKVKAPASKRIDLIVWVVCFLTSISIAIYHLLEVLNRGLKLRINPIEEVVAVERNSDVWDDASIFENGAIGRLGLGNRIEKSCAIR
ncbi:MAG: hypothetical protein GWO26_21725, partial [Phycisphaerae bacterium]|nr:hypothetical protein [Phycisphaerae bacterium]